MENSKVLTLEQTNAALRRKRVMGKVGKIMAMVFIYFVLFLMYSPLLYVAVYSFSTDKQEGGRIIFSLQNYIDLFKINPRTIGNVSSIHDFSSFETYISKLFVNTKYAGPIWVAALNTMIVAISSALISTVLGTLGAIGIYYLRKKWMKNTLDFVTQIPIVNAEIVTAVSLCVLFVIAAKVFHIERSVFTLIIGHVVFSIPFVVLSVKPKLEQMDPSLYEAAMDLGATQTKALWKVIIPDIIPGILSGFLLSITLSLDDYVITVFTKPTTGGFDTISTYVDSVTVKQGLPTQLRAFTAILFVVILIVMVGMNVYSIRKAKKEKVKKGD